MFKTELLRNIFLLIFAKGINVINLSKTFLTAEWRKLVIANYKVSPEILKKYLPYKTELDLWNNICYVSLVGFMFKNVKIRGFKIPFHSDFEEVNLRFYVRHKDEITSEWKRGVVFIKEIVPKAAIAIIANLIYKENYFIAKMKHEWDQTGNSLEIKYNWKFGDSWNLIKVTADPESNEIKEGSEEEFITEHYWGYTRQNEIKTSEYGVEHPRWKMYEVKDYYINADFGRIYGNEFELINKLTPFSVFLAEGSDIKVKEGRKI